MDTVELILRWGPAITMVIFGFHQLTRPLEWLHYIPEALAKMSPFSPETDMRLHSLGNIIIGIWLVTGLFTPIDAWAALIWWVSILPFAFRVSWSIGLRDLSITMSVAALVVMLSR
jgi:uncharacterized membrane protein YphA (DoxX/SURF4 family)